MGKLSARLLGLGTALPKQAIAQPRAAELAQSFLSDDETAIRPLLPKLYSKTGVEQRHSVLLEDQHGEVEQSFYPKSRSADDKGPLLSARMRQYETHAPELARQACCQALDDSGVSAAQISHLVTVSCTGFAAPGVDIALIKLLGLAPTVERTQVGFMGCHGAVNGLRCAAALAAADPRAVVLVCAVELCSLHFHYGSNAEQMVANALFADGAAAAVVGSNAGNGIAGISGFGSYLFPNSEQAMSWRIDDNSFVMSLSASVPNMLRAELAPWFDEWLSRFDMQRRNVQSWAVHPGGPRILGAVEDALALDPEDLGISRAILANVGNMSSPTLLFIIKEILDSGQELPAVMIGFGPGIVAEAALLTR